MVTSLNLLRKDNPLPLPLSEQGVYHSPSKPAYAEEHLVLAITIQVSLVLLGPLIFSKTSSCVPCPQGLVSNRLRMFPAIRIRVNSITGLPDQQA